MWNEPKTNWVQSDRFNFSDYNRIKNNIAYLKERAIEIYLDFPFEDMGADKVSYADYPYADEFTKLESNLERIRVNTFRFDDSESKTWYENQRTPSYEDFNRIEMACLKFYKGLERVKANKGKLSLRLGSGKFVKL